ncbi:MAG: MFS transporter [Streptosporangiales bacterium]|nr:MFS transporter [Streptosporangiales bacterium]
MRQVTVGASTGNVIEWFDYATYGYLATEIGAAFFPFESRALSLLSSFAVFGVAFFMRPVGGLIFGSLGDRLGRRGVLAAVIGLMSLATLAIGFIPGYQTIGLWAPALLVLARFLQGLSGGGEFGGAASYVAEHAPARRRGFYVSLIESSALAGFLLGIVVVLILRGLLPAEAMNDWGWRLPFLAAGPLGLVGLYIRLRLQESPEFQKLEAQHSVAKSPLRESLTRSWRSILVVFGLVIVHNASLYIILTYFNTYMTEQLGISAIGASVATLIVLVVTVVVIPIAGALSDRVGRKPLLLAAAIGFAVLSYPMLLLMNQGNYAVVVIADIVLALLLSCYLGAALPAYIEAFPTRMRYSGFSVAYNLSVAVFGGGAPFFATLLVTSTGNLLSPAFYVIGAALASLVAVVALKERSGSELELT